MADILLFAGNGWTSIWKHKIIFLFSALSLSNLLAFLHQLPIEAGLFDLVFPVALLLVNLSTTVIYVIGVPYLALCHANGRTATIQETLSAVKKLFWQAIGCSCLGLVILLSFIFSAMVFSTDEQTEMLEVPNRILLLSLVFSVFGALWDFALFGFFTNDWSLQESLKNAWSLFKSRFGVLVTLGISVAVIYGICSALSGIITLLIQSGFDPASLRQLNFINPTATLGTNWLFASINGIGNVILSPWRASTFALAFVHYSQNKH